MKTEKGILAIDIATDGNPVITFKPVNGTVWMDRNELCVLFGVYMKAIDESLDSILKMSLFDVNDSCKYHRVVKGNRICFDITEVNLNIIIAMAFRLDSANAHILRQWFITRALQQCQCVGLIPDTGYSYLWN